MSCGTRNATCISTAFKTCWTRVHPASTRRRRHVVQVVQDRQGVGTVRAARDDNHGYAAAAAAALYATPSMRAMCQRGSATFEQPVPHQEICQLVAVPSGLRPPQAVDAPVDVADATCSEKLVRTRQTHNTCSSTASCDATSACAGEAGAEHRSSRTVSAPRAARGLETTEPELGVCNCIPAPQSRPAQQSASNARTLSRLETRVNATRGIANTT